LGLSRPGFPDNAQTFTGKEVKIGALYGMDHTIRGFEIYFEVSDGKNGIWHVNTSPAEQGLEG
jgi:hypothetical protein